MGQVILGAIALLAAWWFLKSPAATSTMSRASRRLLGWAAILAGAFLAMRGRFEIGVPLALLGCGLAGWLPALGGVLGGTGAPRVSRLRSATIEVDLDRSDGSLRGRVLAGRWGGRALETLQPAELLALHREVAGVDPDGRLLLEAYLDRRSPGWREHVQEDPAARAGGRAQRGAMTKEEAYQVLGIEPGTGSEGVRRAHRMLMKKLHPDHGGSTYLAARVNEAKDVLLGGHR